ncbi:unnamed protein product [Cuscuta europaea]|uniref:Uncharacterized protein n=1 Tax=Cuscuta europaea TaxID=41803 RepID=A0A9P1E6D8_CUSEU|nr:unnamed protein product [Cuscuta europaea]
MELPRRINNREHVTHILDGTMEDAHGAVRRRSCRAVVRQDTWIAGGETKVVVVPAMTWVAAIGVEQPTVTAAYDVAWNDGGGRKIEEKFWIFFASPDLRRLAVG